MIQYSAFLKSTLRLLPIFSLLLAGSLLLPSCSDSDKKPAAAKKSGKKKGKKKKKAQKATEQTDTPLPSEQAVKAPSTPEEAMHALNDLLNEAKCVEDSALSPEEKKAVYQKLVPHAVSIGSVAHKAGGIEVIQEMLGNHGQNLYNELRAEIEKNNISPKEMDARPELQPKAFRDFWGKWVSICEHYKVNPNRLRPGGLPGEAGAIALALRGASQADVTPATAATAQEVADALHAYAEGFNATLSGDDTPDAKGEALLRLNNSIYKYILAMQADKALYDEVRVSFNTNELKALNPPELEASNYEGSATLKSAVKSTIHLWTESYRELHRAEPPLRW